MIKTRLCRLFAGTVLSILTSIAYAQTLTPVLVLNKNPCEPVRNLDNEFGIVTDVPAAARTDFALVLGSGCFISGFGQVANASTNTIIGLRIDGEEIWNQTVRYLLESGATATGPLGIRVSEVDSILGDGDKYLNVHFGFSTPIRFAQEVALFVQNSQISVELARGNILFSNQ